VILVVGKREMEEGGVNMRRFGSQQQKSLRFDEALEELVREAAPPDLRRV
jgi:threonyl-tRNA synthetase